MFFSLDVNFTIMEIKISKLDYKIGDFGGKIFAPKFSDGTCQKQTTIWKIIFKNSQNSTFKHQIWTNHCSALRMRLLKSSVYRGSSKCWSSWAMWQLLNSVMDLFRELYRASCPESLLSWSFSFQNRLRIWPRETYMSFRSFQLLSLTWCLI